MSNKPPHVLLLTAGRADNYAGGPVLTMRLLLMENEAAGEPLEMSAVFCDRAVSSYQDLIAIAPRERPVRGGLHLLAILFLSTLGFLFHLGRSCWRLGRTKAVFHAHGIAPAYLCPLLFRGRYPLILTFHGKGGHIREPLLQYPILRVVEKVLRHIEMTAVRRANVVVFPSKGAQALFESQYPDLLLGKDVRIVRWSVNFEELDSASLDSSLPTRYGIGPETFVIICVGKLIKDKGIDTLIEAIATLPENIRSQLSCLIVGGGALEKELQSLIVQTGVEDKIRMLGFLPRGELLGLMKRADLFVAPYVVSVFDAALLEAGAMRLPIVTTAVGGNLEMFDQDSAVLIPPNDAQVLAAAITRMLTDEALRNRFAENAYQRIRSKFSPESMLDSHVALYKEMLARGE